MADDEESLPAADAHVRYLGRNGMYVEARASGERYQFEPDSSHRIYTVRRVDLPQLLAQTRSCCGGRRTPLFSQVD